MHGTVWTNNMYIPEIISFSFFVRDTIYQSHSSSGEIYHEGLLQSENLQIYKLSWVQNNILKFRSTGQVCDFLFFFQYFHNIASRQGKLSVWNQFLSKCILHVLISLRCAFYDCYVLFNSLSVCEGAKTCFLFHYSNLIILNRSIMTSMIMCNWYWQI